jgi:transposase
MAPMIGAMIGKVLLTVGLFNTSINTEIFDAWVIQDLIPKLPPQSVVVMDNATFHQGHTLLYLPPYSPDLNPIEHKWAQAKALRRKLQCPIEVLFNVHSL